MKIQQDTRHIILVAYAVDIVTIEESEKDFKTTICYMMTKSKNIAIIYIEEKIESMILSKNIHL